MDRYDKINLLANELSVDFFKNHQIDINKSFEININSLSSLLFTAINIGWTEGRMEVTLKILNEVNYG
jgi:hypothetical protein